jgi:two-component system, NtrC family, response regulator HydG
MDSILIADLNLERRASLAARFPGRVISENPTNCHVALTVVKSLRPSAFVLGSICSSANQTLSLASTVSKLQPSAGVILLVDDSCEELAIGAIRAGVRDYFRPPLLLDEVAAAVNRLADRRTPPSNFGLIGKSDAISKVREMIQVVAPKDVSVTITGETGTGKELVARCIHAHSSRSQKPMVCVNCAAVPESLIESELFGYEKGAFTGANNHYSGRFMLANGGTLFLDEVGDMSAAAQAKVLRAVETGEIRPVGSSKSISTDIRIISATHRDLVTSVRDRRFREDLLFRLNIVEIRVPPLRDRREDIPLLANHFVNHFNVRYRREIKGVTPAALRRLCDHEWPGNIRQLQNAIEAASVTTSSDWIGEDDLLVLNQRISHEPVELSGEPDTKKSHSATANQKDSLIHALEVTRWNVTKAAEYLGWSRMTVYRRMAKYQLQRN